VEIAPGKVWSDPSNVTTTDARAYRAEWEQAGVPIVAMQSLLFGHPELTLFQNAHSRADLLDYLTRIFDLAQTLGAQSLIFGSPKNRARGALPEEKANAIAVDFFKKAGAAAHDRGVVLCLEANARQYACDFINTTDQAAALVAAVDSPGFCLHMDWGCMDLEGEDVLQQVRLFGAQARHFHLSSAGLQPILDRDRSTIEKIVHEFTQVGGNAWASVEMLNPKGELETIRAVLREIGPCFESR
jgi:D-psicose/D-tagatose/L-ribulose 3-epimerase